MYIKYLATINDIIICLGLCSKFKSTRKQLFRDVMLKTLDILTSVSETETDIADR